MEILRKQASISLVNAEKSIFPGTGPQFQSINLIQTVAVFEATIYCVYDFTFDSITLQKNLKFLLSAVSQQ